MVAEVFEDMTNKGGIFYDMQMKQANTLYGIYQKLTDNIQQAFYRVERPNEHAERRRKPDDRAIQNLETVLEYRNGTLSGYGLCGRGTICC